MGNYAFTRRGLLKTAAGAVVGLSVPSSFSVGAGGGGASMAVNLSAGPHLFIDDYLIEEQTDLRRVVNPPRKLPEPVITGKEDGCFEPYVTVIRDPGSRRFRVWYNVPENASRSHLAYMESEDGVHRIRPHRVLKDPAFIRFGASVIDEGVGFADKDRRYKYGWWADGGLKVASSPDGLNWTPMAPGVVLPHNHDINSIFKDPRTGEYIALVSSYTTGDKWSGNRRVVMQSVSRDLIHWRKPWRIIEPDEKDEGETQFYCMAGLIRRGDLLIGLVKVLRDEAKVEGAPENAQGIGYTELAWTRDGKHWTREREPFLPRNPQTGSWDHAMTWGDCQLIVGAETFIYYGGYMWGHKYERFTQRQIGLARMPVDHYVSRKAMKGKGRLRTRLFTTNASQITVNADIDGSLQVRVLDRSGAPIPGFDWTDCESIRGSSIAHPVRWKADFLSIAGRPIKLEFALDRVRLYGFGLEM